jgi:hypothetical protein
LSFGGGAGPSFDRVTSEILFFQSLGINTTNQLNLSAYGGLTYSLKTGAAAFSYQRATTSGSGIFAGANTDVASLSYSRSLVRKWGGSFSSGYARLKQIQENSGLAGSPVYQSWYTGVSATRSMGRRMGLFIGYQFANESTTNSVCMVSHCISRQSVASVGLTWRGPTIRFTGENPKQQGSGDANSPLEDDSKTP